MIFCLSGDFIFWVKSPLTNALLVQRFGPYREEDVGLELAVNRCLGLLGFSGRDRVIRPRSTRGMTWVLMA